MGPYSRDKRLIGPGFIPKAKSPVSSTLQSRKPAISFVNVVLCLDDARRNEEDQLLV
jgi:hypothetical protein